MVYLDENESTISCVLRLKLEIVKTMKNIDKRKTLIVICAVIAIMLIGAAIREATRAVTNINVNTDFNAESLRWAIIGAIGSWAGSIFSAIALLISLFALWLPQRVKIVASISAGIMVCQPPVTDDGTAYIITVKNLSQRPVTINNVYLHFGNKEQGDLFIGMINQGTPFQYYTPTLPKRLDQGESFDYYLSKDRVDKAMIHYKSKWPLNSRLSIRTDEVTKGNQYHRTNWTLKTFVGE